MKVSSTITARSQAIWISLPPPTQTPLIRASVGLPMRRIAVTPVVHRAEPLPVLALVADEAVLGPRAQVRADAERTAGAGQHDDADVVVVGGVLAGAGELPEHRPVEGVQDLRPVEGDRRARRRLLVQDRLEAELLGGAGGRLVKGRQVDRVRHAHLGGVLPGRAERRRSRRPP